MPGYGVRPHQTGRRRSRHAELPRIGRHPHGMALLHFRKQFRQDHVAVRSGKESLGVIFDQIGTPTYARDLAVAIFAVLTQDFVPGIYHFSNEGAISWYDFTKAIHRIAGITTCKVRPLHTEEYPAPAARPHYSVLDKTKIKETYHIDIPYWEDSLTECIQKLEQN